MAGALLCLVGCTQHPSNLDRPHPDAIRVRAAAGTPTEADGHKSPYRPAFAQGDAIGVIMNDSPVHVARLGMSDEGPSWQFDTPLLWGDSQATARFYAFTPVAERDVTAERIPMPDLTRQSGRPADVAHYGFMVASAQTSRAQRGGWVDFTGASAFTHPGTLLVFKPQAESLQGIDLQQLKLKGKGIATRTFYTFGSGQGVHVDPASEIVSELTLLLDAQNLKADSALCLIINPTEGEVSVSLEYAEQGAARHTDAVVLGNSFKANNLYQYKLVLEKGKVRIKGVEIADWIVNDPKEIVLTEQ